MKTKKSLLIILTTVALSLVIFGCTPQLVIRPQIPGVVLDTGSVQQPSVPVAGQDSHYLTATDFFFMEESLRNDQGWDLAFLGKIIQAPTIETDNQAQMLRVQDGATVWASWVASTRIATNADIALGKTVVFFDSNWDENDVRMPPKTNKDARSQAWLISRITDTNEMFKGYVLCGGGIKVSVKNLRVPVIQ